jgi:excisionase family DNA binding protein
MIEAENFYTTAEVADFLNIKTSTLKKWRHIKKFNPPHFKFGGGVRYKGADLLSWIERNKK